MKRKILIVFGTRPEAIKMAPLVKEFEQNQQTFETKVCITAQHGEMLDQVLSFFEIKPDFDLNLMQKNQTLFDLTARIINGSREVLETYKPDLVFVHGDTTTSMAFSLTAFYSGSKVCHIEAGLRTNNKLSPFPEEMNRQLTGRLADYHFAPTENAKRNLLKENINNKFILVTGNTVIDALFLATKKIKNHSSDVTRELSHKISDKEMILVTAHRRENHGEGFENICKALKTIAEQNPSKVIVYPVHLNPNVQEPVNRILSNIENILLIEPVGYPDFVWLMHRSKLIITDSGGIQEEAPSLNKPVLVMRDTTERPEALDAGAVVLVGTDVNLIVDKTNELLSDENSYQKTVNVDNPYGDGKACSRVVQFFFDLKD